MDTNYTLEEVSVDSLFETINKKKEDGYRLIQICATAFEGYNEIIYSFGLEYKFENYKIKLNIDDEIQSIDQLFPSAMLYENEIKELFGVKVVGISLDYQNRFYRIDKETPFKKQIKITKKEDKDNG